MKQVIVQNVPEDLKRNFKTLCSKNDTKMTTVLRDYMAELCSKFQVEIIAK